MFILIINIRLVAYCWFLCLHPTFMMHGHKSLKFWMIFKSCAQLSPEFKFKALHHTASYRKASKYEVARRGLWKQ